jgi:FtsH-binding integral membrane protein
MPMLGLIVSSIALFFAMASETTRQSSPMRWPLFAAFTIGQSIPVGFIASLYAYGTVVKAMMTTAAATIAITLYTVCQKNPKYDLSQWGRALSGLVSDMAHEYWRTLADYLTARSWYAI